MIFFFFQECGSYLKVERETSYIWVNSGTWETLTSHTASSGFCVFS